VALERANQSVDPFAACQRTRAVGIAEPALDLFECFPLGAPPFLERELGALLELAIVGGHWCRLPG
jgi:hypothetical protein